MRDFRGVIAVPPLCRRGDGSFDWVENGKVVKHLAAGGITRLMYGGNAFLYHVTLNEYELLLDWLSGLDQTLSCIPSAGPSYGRLIDQAVILRHYSFPVTMALPCADPRDALGLETGLRRFSDAAGMPVIVYLKEENNFGTDRNAGLDSVARLVKDGVCVGIKYAVVRQDPAKDPYLEALLQRVDHEIVISGIGERPAIAHLRHFGLPGFTSGSVCLAPSKSNRLFEACQRSDFEQASKIREEFLALEDLRDQLGPARVLHAAVELAGIAATGPIPPFVTALNQAQFERLKPVAQAL